MALQGGALPEPVSGRAMLPIELLEISDQPDYAKPANRSVDGRAILDNLWRPAQKFLGCRYGIVGGAMSWVSDHVLVAAISEAGGFGVYAAAAMPPAALRDGIMATQALTRQPFGVNVITFHPEFERMIGVCIETGVSHVVLAGGMPSSDAIKRLKRADVRVMCFGATLAMARRVLKSGADAIIIEGMEAGGHIGPVSTMVLAQEILPHIDEVPVFVAGGIGRGESMAAYLVMGAAGCQIGTKLATARESCAHARFKQALIGAKARDAVVSPNLDPLFRVIPVRALANPAMDGFGSLQRTLMDRMERGEISAADSRREIEEYWAGRLRDAVVEGDVKNGSLMAGQCVAMVTSEQTVAEILEEMVEQAAVAVARLCRAGGQLAQLAPQQFG